MNTQSENHNHIKSRFTVLLVEDDLNDIFLVKRAFKKACIPNPLQVVTDGVEAIHYLQGDGKYADRQLYPLPHLIVMDIKMPRKTGFEVLEWIKRDGMLKRIPVIIVSSSDQPHDINRAYEMGANAYMVKPVDFRAVESLFQSITHYWGLECAKPELDPEPHEAQA
jgi:CheY-like chemotaxis protein